MSLPRRSCRRVTPLTWFGLALGLAIVLWGACYKMEQYPQRGCAFRVMSPAKLLTERERPERVRTPRFALASPSAVRQPPLYPPAWIAFARRAPLYVRPPALLVPAARFCNIGNAEFTYFSFRPPPARFTS
jgi:hypothetical protein